MNKDFWIMRLTDENGFPSEYLARTLALSEDEAWEKYLYKEIEKDIACKARKPHDPFPEYWKQRNHLILYGNKAVQIEIIEKLKGAEGEMKC